MTKILFVEDDPMIAEIYERKFREVGFNVKSVTTGADVLNIVQIEKFDLVLLDIVLPEMNGIDVLKALKTDGNNPAMKVYIFSNLNSKEDQDRAFRNGADGFIAKAQYSPSELVEEVRRILQELKEHEKNTTPSATDVGGKTTQESRKRILLIEDEGVFADMFGKKLQDEGYDVTIAKNGAWGIKEVQQKTPDLIIMDMMMPAMSGLEMLTKIRQNEGTKDTPVIVISASATDEEIAGVKELGIEEYFIKTRVTPSDLARKVNHILR